MPFAVDAVADIGSAAAGAVVVAVGTAVLEGTSAAHLAFYSVQSFAHSQTAGSRKAVVVTLNQPQDLGCYLFGNSHSYLVPAVAGAVAGLFDTVGAVVVAAAAAAAVIEKEELRRCLSPWPPQGDHPMDFH